jgi:hypothetical protein
VEASTTGEFDTIHSTIEHFNATHPLDISLLIRIPLATLALHADLFNTHAIFEEKERVFECITTSAETAGTFLFLLLTFTTFTGVAWILLEICVFQLATPPSRWIASSLMRLAKSTDKTMQQGFITYFIFTFFVTTHPHYIYIASTRGSWTSFSSRKTRSAPLGQSTWISWSDLLKHRVPRARVARFDKCTPRSSRTQRRCMLRA